MEEVGGGSGEALVSREEGSLDAVRLEEGLRGEGEEGGGVGGGGG